jgi:hypothetical protein
MSCSNAHEERLTYLRHFKRNQLLSGEERVAEFLFYSRLFDTQIVDTILAPLEDKRIEVSPYAATKAQASVQFGHR